MYLVSPGRPLDIGLQLGKACYPCIAGKGRGVMFLFLLFFFFLFFFSVSSIFLSPLSLSFISSTISSVSLLPFTGSRHKMTHNG